MMDGYITSRGTTDSNFTWDIGANYYAKKYDNGVMELYGKYMGNVTTTNIWGSGPVYYQSMTKMNFPVQFKNTPYVIPVLCRENSGAVFNVVPENIDAIGFNCYMTSMSGQVTNLPYSLSYMAIGNWK